MEKKVEIQTATQTVKDILVNKENNLLHSNCEALRKIAAEHDSLIEKNDALSKSLEQSNERINALTEHISKLTIDYYKREVGMLLDIIYFITVKPNPGQKNDRDMSS